MKICLMGLPGAGKSTVLGFFRSRSFQIVEMDKIGHEILRDSNVRESLREIFDDRIFIEDEIDRGILGRIVFSDPDKLRKLEEVIHPEAIKKLYSINGENLLVECPLFFRMKIVEFFDEIIFLDVPFETRLERVSIRGWSPDDLLKRDKSILEEFKGNSRLIRRIFNTGSITCIEEKLQRILDGDLRCSLPVPASDIADDYYNTYSSEGPEVKAEKRNGHRDEYDYLYFTIKD